MIKTTTKVNSFHREKTAHSMVSTILDIWIAVVPMLGLGVFHRKETAYSLREITSGVVIASIQKIKSFRSSVVLLFLSSKIFKQMGNYLSNYTCTGCNEVILNQKKRTTHAKKLEFMLRPNSFRVPLTQDCSGSQSPLHLSKGYS